VGGDPPTILVLRAQAAGKIRESKSPRLPWGKGAIGLNKEMWGGGVLG